MEALQCFEGLLIGNTILGKGGKGPDSMSYMMLLSSLCIFAPSVYGGDISLVHCLEYYTFILHSKQVTLGVRSASVLFAWRPCPWEGRPSDRVSWRWGLILYLGALISEHPSKFYLGPCPLKGVASFLGQSIE